MAHQITFGEKIRSLRVGWFPAHQRQCWVRISDCPGGFEVDLSPFGEKIPDVGGEYRDLRGENVDALLSLHPCFRAVSRIRRRFSFRVDAPQ